MWKKVQNGDLIRPADIDATSSQKFVYFRKEITLIDDTHYEWLEIKIPKDDWAVFQQVLAHDEALDDVYAALAELAELVV